MTIQTYGHDGTIHGSEHVDVEVDNQGKVVGVWFRCICVNFEQVNVDNARAVTMREIYEHNDPAPIRIKAIQYDDGLVGESWIHTLRGGRAPWFWQRWRKWLSEALADPDAVEHPPER